MNQIQGAGKSSGALVFVPGEKAFYLLHADIFNTYHSKNCLFVHYYMKF